jgi:hypothetical protein
MVLPICRQDHRHCLCVDRLHHGISLGGQEAIDLMRPRDRLRLGARVTVKSGPDASEREKCPVFIEREPHHVLFLGLRVRLRRVFGEAGGRDKTTVRSGPGGMPQRIVAISVPVSVLRMNGAG